MQVVEQLCVLEGRIAAQEALLEKKHAETTKLLLSLGANPNAAASNSAPPPLRLHPPKATQWTVPLQCAELN